MGGDYSMTHLWMITIPGYEMTLNTFPWRTAGSHVPRNSTYGRKFIYRWVVRMVAGRESYAVSAQRVPDLGSAETSDIYVIVLGLDRTVQENRFHSRAGHRSSVVARRN